jgi:hypothetical protein
MYRERGYVMACHNKKKEEYEKGKKFLASMDTWKMNVDIVACISLSQRLQ